MTDPDASRHVEVREGDHPVAAADVTTAAGAEGTARASLHATPGHIPPGSRASLVDAVMDLPEVQASTRLEATVPIGDGESLQRLRERTDDAVTRPAGSTALLDANIPQAAGREAGAESAPQEPQGGLAAPQGSLPAPDGGLSAPDGGLSAPDGDLSGWRRTR
jgi:hypothetical protein